MLIIKNPNRLILVGASVCVISSIETNGSKVQDFAFLSSIFCTSFMVLTIHVYTLFRVQLGECLKTIIHSDYPEQWPSLLGWVKHNLQDQQVYGALYVLRILSRKYE